MTYGTRTDHYPATSLEARYEVGAGEECHDAMGETPKQPFSAYRQKYRQIVSLGGDRSR